MIAQVTAPAIDHLYRSESQTAWKKGFIQVSIEETVQTRAIMRVWVGREFGDLRHLRQVQSATAKVDQSITPTA